METKEKFMQLKQKVKQLHKLVDEINEMELMPQLKARCYIAESFGEYAKNNCVKEIPAEQNTEQQKE